jgi:nitrous oxidase accessory protein NosD
MENSQCAGEPVGVGIRVVGEPEDSGRIPEGGVWRQSTAEVVKNVISGAINGVDVNSDVLDVKFSGNTLIGNPGDTGICSEAENTSTKGKPNVWSGYFAEDEIRYVDCLLVW